VHGDLMSSHLSVAMLPTWGDVPTEIVSRTNVAGTLGERTGGGFPVPASWIICPKSVMVAPGWGKNPGKRLTLGGRPSRSLLRPAERAKTEGSTGAPAKSSIRGSPLWN